MAIDQNTAFNPQTMYIDAMGMIRLKDPDASRAMLAANDNTTLDFSKYTPSVFPVSGILDTNQANMFYDRGELDELTEAMPEEEDDEGGGITKLLNFLNPLGFLQNMFGAPQPYERFSPGTTIDSRGIVNVAGVSTPYNMFGGDFYDPNTGLNRFDRAKARYDKTGSTADLFASSRTGTEFFSKLRERKAAKQKALEDAAKEKRKINTFTGRDVGPIDIKTSGGNIGDRVSSSYRDDKDFGLL
jgi:hypothetical protein